MLAITGALFGVNLYGTLMLKQYSDQTWFLPVESVSYKYEMTNTEVTTTTHVNLFLSNIAWFTLAS